MQPLLLMKIMIMFGLAMWLSIACLNNIIDKNTNRHLIKNMLNMSLIKEDGVLGQGLLTRAWHKDHYAKIILGIVITAQAIISVLLWLGGFEFLMLQFDITSVSIKTAMLISNYGLLSFMSLWLCFLCGGLWFGYWIKMGQVQIVHMTLLLISLLASIVINLPINYI
jgi:predicted small integral membrane protein